MSTPRSLRPGLRPDADVDPLAFPPFTHARRLRAELTAGILRSGRSIPDETFDEIYPDVIRRVSPTHWTPVHVCARVVELLRLQPGVSLLDVGAGAGKFCIVAAAMSGARIRGIEREPRLVEVAREAARRLGVNVELALGEFDAEDPHSVDAAYLFNPFSEQILLPRTRDVAEDRFASRTAADIAAAESFFERAPIGMRLVTFWGFGGTLPAGYARLARETWDGGVLELWERTSAENERSSSR